VLRLDLAGSGLQDHPAGPFGHAVHTVARQHVATSGADVVRIGSHHARVVDDAGIGRKQRLDAHAMGLDLTQAFGSDHLQALDAVRQATLQQVLQSRELVLGVRDDDFAAAIGGDALLLAVGVHLALALDAQARLE
jgi:hypothetical protein